MSSINQQAHRMMLDAATANLVRELTEVKRIADAMIAGAIDSAGGRVYVSNARQLAVVTAEAVRYNAEVAALEEATSLVGGES